MLPDILKSTPPAPPVKLSYSCNLTMDRKQSREMRRTINPLTRPAHVSPKKRVSWRLRKKWFNRYQKPVWLEQCVVAVSKDGKTKIPLRIGDVRMLKAGGHSFTLSFASISTTTK